MAYNEDSSGSGHDEPWIQWFCGLKGHEMFCEVERSYIEDGFNLYGLRASVSNFSDCLDLILDRIGPDDSDDSHLTQSACTLYGLIHARYIITAHGLDAMYNKYAAKEFGTCPLVQCEGQPVLPVGLKDEMGADTVRIFCPKCQCVYHPPPVRSRNSHRIAAGPTAAVDGAAFGTTFPHLFLMTFSNLVPDPLPPDSAYVPRVFGFRVHNTARQRLLANNSAAAAAAASSHHPVAATTTSSAAVASTTRSLEPVQVNEDQRLGEVSQEAMDVDGGAMGGDGGRPKDGKQNSAPKVRSLQQVAPPPQQQPQNNSRGGGMDMENAPSLKQSTTTISTIEGRDDDDDVLEASKPSKTGKRRSEGEIAAANRKSDGNDNGFVEISSKRRRKPIGNGGDS